MRSLRRRLDAIAHYSALLLILLSLTPAFLGAGAVHLPGAQGRIAICTAFGISYVSAEEVGKTPPYKPQQSHCPSCVLQGMGAAILPTPPALEKTFSGRADAVFPFSSFSLSADAYSLAQPRGPPANFS